MSEMPKISAIICTHNRSEVLAEAVQSLTEQTLDSRQYEVLVVDNASTDDTARVVGECQRRFAGCRIRLVREDTPGLSIARNTGFRESLGRHVAYLDDDAVAAPDWLKAGLEGFETAGPKPLAVVGPVYPRYPDGKPDWFNDRFETFDLGADPIQLTARQSFMGGNAMFRKSVLADLGGFDPNMGLKGKRLWLGEEVELLLRMRQAFGSDCCIRYDPRVSILHAIGRHKLSVRYVLRRRFLNGRCKYLMQIRNGHAGRMRQLARSAAWAGWLSLSAAGHAVCYRSFRSWVTERGAPVAVHLGQLAAALSTPSHKDFSEVDTGAAFTDKGRARAAA